MSKGTNNIFHDFIKKESAPVTQMIWSVFVFNMELANGRSVFAGLKNQRFWFNSKRLRKIYLRVVRMVRHQSAKLIYAGSSPVPESNAPLA